MSFLVTACGKHQQSLYDDDVEIGEMHPTLSSNRMMVSSMIAGNDSCLLRHLIEAIR